MTLLEAERRRRGWNQTQLAFHAQLTPGEISRFERRKRQPSARHAARLSRVLGLPPEVLQFEVTEAPTRSAWRGRKAKV